jgi:predicted membrane protein
MKREKSRNKRAVLGLLLTIAGFFLLANNMGWISDRANDIIFSWPMILIALGLLNMVHRGHLGFGVVLLATGAFFLVPNIMPVPQNYSKLFWAFIFVAIGLLIIFRSKKDHRCYYQPSEKYSSETVDDVNIFGGCEKKISSQNFKGGRITSIFGGGTYDMLDCKIEGDKAVIDTLYLFGGSKMIVPSDWEVHIDVISIFGGFTDKRRNTNVSQFSQKKELYITGVAIFGGGEIKSY